MFNKLKIDIALVALFTCTNIVVVRSAEPEMQGVKSKVTERDARGRVKVMEMHAKGGVCIAEVIYESRPRIHIVVVSRTQLRNLGFVQINNVTKDDLTDMTLMKIFTKGIKEHCLPFIIPGYVAT